MSEYVIKTINGVQHLEHRLIMEEHLGRKLSADEVVHHINGDKKDNRIDNLQVMTWSEHSRLEGEKQNSSPGKSKKLRDSQIGKSNYASRKFTDEQMLEIAERLAEGAELKPMADELGVSDTVLRLFLRGETYRNVFGLMPEETKAKLAERAGKMEYKPNVSNRKLSNNQVSDIRLKLQQGTAINALAREYSISRTVIKAIAYNETYKDVPWPRVPVPAYDTGSLREILRWSDEIAAPEFLIKRMREEYPDIAFHPTNAGLILYYKYRKLEKADAKAARELIEMTGIGIDLQGQ